MSDTSASKAVQDARINEAVAEDVAAGMAQKAERQEVRANLYATEAAHKAEVADVLRQNAARAQAESRSTKFTLYLVLGTVFIGAIALAAYFLNRPKQTDAPNIIKTTRPVELSPTPGPGLLQTNPNPPVPAATPKPAPSVVRVVVPVAVPVPVPVRDNSAPVHQSATPAPDPAPAAAPASGATGDKPLQGYVDPKG